VSSTIVSAQAFWPSVSRVPSGPVSVGTNSSAPLSMRSAASQPTVKCVSSV
jgi:hypothetical protein